MEGGGRLWLVDVGCMRASYSKSHAPVMDACLAATDIHQCSTSSSMGSVRTSIYNLEPRASRPQPQYYGFFGSSDFISKHTDLPLTISLLSRCTACPRAVVPS